MQMCLKYAKSVQEKDNDCNLGLGRGLTGLNSGSSGVSPPFSLYFHDDDWLN